MKTISKFFLIFSLILIAVLAFPTSVSAAPLNDGRTILGESYTLESGGTLEGDLRVFGGILEIEQDATVDGSVIIFGGSATIDGTVTENLVVFGGTVKLEENAIIKKDVFSPGSNVSQDKGAVIEGNKISTWDNSWQEFNPSVIQTPRTIISERVRFLPIINRIGRAIGMTLLFAALGGLMILVMPKSANVMSSSLLAKPWEMLGFGALSGLATLILSLILAITICLAPFGILLLLVVSLATLAGWLTLGYELGKQIVTGIFKSKWHPALIAVLGNLVLYVLARLIGFIPCLGSFLVFVVMLFGLGVAVVTLFGTRAFPRGSDQDDGKQQVLFQDKKNEDQVLPEIDKSESEYNDQE